MSSSPEVSVVMASTASDTDVALQALGSVATERDIQLEIVLILDGVSKERARLLQNKEFSVPTKILVSQKRRGLARCLNAGIRVAKGKFVARMDDDDISLPGRVSALVEFMKAGGFDVVGSAAYVIDHNGMRTGELIHGADFSRALSPFQLAFTTLFIHPTVVLRRSWALRHKYRSDWGRGQDRELWVRTYETSSFGTLSHPLLEYRRGPTPKSAQLANVESAFRLLREHKAIFGYWLPALWALNMFRWIRYRIRVR